MAAPRAPARLRLAPHLVLGAFCAGLAGALAVTVPAGAAVVATAGCALGSAALAARGRAAAGVVLLVAAAGLAGWAWGDLASRPPTPRPSTCRRARAD